MPSPVDVRHSFYKGKGGCQSRRYRRTAKPRLDVQEEIYRPQACVGGMTPCRDRAMHGIAATDHRLAAEAQQLCKYSVSPGNAPKACVGAALVAALPLVFESCITETHSGRLPEPPLQISNPGWPNTYAIIDSESLY